jgi:hypothetical protein
MHILTRSSPAVTFTANTASTTLLGKLPSSVLLLLLLLLLLLVLLLLLLLLPALAASVWSCITLHMQCTL